MNELIIVNNFKEKMTIDNAYTEFYETKEDDGVTYESLNSWNSAMKHFFKYAMNNRN